MSERWILKECPKCGFGRYIDDEWEQHTLDGKEIVSMHVLRAPKGNIFVKHCQECDEWMRSWKGHPESKEAKEMNDNEKPTPREKPPMYDALVGMARRKSEILKKKEEVK